MMCVPPAAMEGEELNDFVDVGLVLEDIVDVGVTVAEGVRVGVTAKQSDCDVAPALLVVPARHAV